MDYDGEQDTDGRREQGTAVWPINDWTTETPLDETPYLGRPARVEIVRRAIHVDRVTGKLKAAANAAKYNTCGRCIAAS